MPSNQTLPLGQRFVDTRFIVLQSQTVKMDGAVPIGRRISQYRHYGMMCNEDPDDPKCYYIHDGVKKVVEAHTTRRGSFPYVFFASDSVINTGDANQNGNGKNVLIQCDYRPLNEPSA